MPRFKSITFYCISPKIKLFLQKNAKLSSAGGKAPRLPCLRRLGALPPNPKPPGAGGLAPRLPLVSGGWGFRPHTPRNNPPPLLRLSGYAPVIESASRLIYDVFDKLLLHVFAFSPNLNKSLPIVAFP